MEGSLLFKVSISLLTLHYFQVSFEVFAEQKQSDGTGVAASHPMLYFSGPEVNEMRIKASGSHAKIVELIKVAGKELTDHPDYHLPPISFEKFGDKWNEIYGNNLCGFSMYCLLYPDNQKALRMVKIFMDRMASYPDWYVTDSRGKDEVPVGHSLTGFATAYDFLYLWLEPERRQKYAEKIKNETLLLANVLNKHHMGWTKQYIHNHAASNIVGILLGALVISVKEPSFAKPIIEHAREHLDMAMEILSHITDGSMDEGISYGSYTSRGLTQYVYLAKRHWNVDHTDNPWLKEHFWFYYETMLPGFQRAAGTADANHNWYFGPESQIVFLDTYVMRNGYGNWLADKIRRAKPKNKPLAPSSAQRWSMLHTEFIFYDPTLKPIKPLRLRNSSVHIFPDWGVVTYGASEDMEMGKTFLYFKSGALNGEAVGEILDNKYYQGQVSGWENFNPGHEHPDQNTFVFAPNGRYFITEALYGPKYSYLDNVILFAPSSTSRCNQPWEGQLGECEKWLRYKDWPNTRGEIVSTAESDSMLFAAGQSVNAYDKSLGLTSVFRGLILLNPEVLVVVDCIQRLPDSTTKVASAVFHNMMHEFKEFSHLGHNGAQITYPEGKYRMFSFAKGTDTLSTTLHKGVQPPGLRVGPTNYINVTFDLKNEITHVVHVFTGPRYEIKSATFLSTPSQYGVRLSLNVNRQEYEISMATITNSVSRKVDPVKERIKLTGYGGYANVKMGYEQHFFGYKKVNGSKEWLASYPSYPKVSGGGKDRYFLENEMNSLANTANFLSSPTRYKRSLGIHEVSTAPGTFFINENTVRLYYIFIFVGLAFMIFIISRVRMFSKWKLSKKMLFGLGVLFILIVINVICIDNSGTNTCWPRQAEELAKMQIRNSYNLAKPFVFISSLPQSGAEILENVFDNSTDFLYVPMPHETLSIPTAKIDTNQPDLCLWSSLHNEFNLLTMGWFSSIAKREFLHFNNLPEAEQVARAKRHVRENRNPVIAVSAGTGFWNTKIPWIRSVMEDGSARPILFVRDARSWIFALIQNKDDGRGSKTLSSLLQVYDKLEISCSEEGLEPLIYVEAVRKYRETKSEPPSAIEKLAMVWMISMATALHNEAMLRPTEPLQIVRFEDILSEPEETAKVMFARLGMPLNIKRLSKLVRTVKSGFFSLSGEGEITPSLADRWREKLSEGDIERIEDICCPLLRILNYECVGNSRG